MKANEVPEKIYIQLSTIEEFPHQNIVYTKSLADNSIEYTRTNTFIKKACEWMKKNGCGYWLDDSALPNRDLIEEFRKYMKGE